MLKINIAKDFSQTPGARYPHEGKFSGQEFRKVILLPKIWDSLLNNEKLLIDFDGSAGYGSGFLEESFGGLIRVNQLPYERLTELLEFKSDEEPYIIDDIKGYMSDAHNRSSL